MPQKHSKNRTLKLTLVLSLLWSPVSQSVLAAPAPLMQPDQEGSFHLHVSATPPQLPEVLETLAPEKDGLTSSLTEGKPYKKADEGFRQAGFEDEAINKPGAAFCITVNAVILFAMVKLYEIAELYVTVRFDGRINRVPDLHWHFML